LTVPESILVAGQWRVAYNADYDIYRHARRGFDLAASYRIRALLYAGRPDWLILDTLTPARIR